MTERNPELAVFDFAEALTLAGTNKASLKKSLTTFINNISSELEKLQNALEQDNISTVTKIAHKITGSSGYLGAHQIKNTCEQITDTCKSQNLKNLRLLVNDLNQQTTLFLETIKKLRVLDVLD